MPCKRCQERGQTWKGAAPKCAFTGSGKFKTENWNCATMNALRELVEDSERAPWSEDQYAAVISIGEGDFIVLSWYKHRGCTEVALVLPLGKAKTRPLTLEDADAALRLNRPKENE